MFALKRLLPFRSPLYSCIYLRRSKSTSVLLNRSIIKVSGQDTIPFLQGLITNDARHLTEDSGTSVTLPCMYTLLLNIQGRVLYDALLYRAPGSDGKEIWLECDTGISEDVAKLLKKYRVRKKIDINVAEDLTVWATANEGCVKQPVIFAKDPRFQHTATTTSSVTFELAFRAITDDTQKPTNDLDYYKLQRYIVGVGEGVNEHPPSNCFPLEINGDYLHGVSFFKGCYVGQELTSRTHHLGVVRKRYMPVTFNDLPTCNIPTGTIIENETGKNVGKFINRVDLNGLALLRIQEATAAKELKVKGHGFKLTTSVPDWWPKKEPTKTN